MIKKTKKEAEKSLEEVEMFKMMRRRRLYGR